METFRHREDRFLNFEQQISSLARTHIAALEELGVCIDRRKRMTHIVGYRTCHFADCRHPLCLDRLDRCTPLRLVSQIQTNALVEHEDIAALRTLRFPGVWYQCFPL